MLQLPAGPQARRVRVQDRSQTSLSPSGSTPGRRPEAQQGGVGWDVQDFRTSLTQKSCQSCQMPLHHSTQHLPEPGWGTHAGPGCGPAPPTPRGSWVLSQKDSCLLVLKLPGGPPHSPAAGGPRLAQDRHSIFARKQEGTLASTGHTLGLGSLGPQEEGCGVGDTPGSVPTPCPSVERLQALPDKRKSREESCSSPHPTLVGNLRGCFRRRHTLVKGG